MAYFFVIPRQPVSEAICWRSGVAKMSTSARKLKNPRAMFRAQRGENKNNLFS